MGLCMLEFTINNMPFAQIPRIAIHDGFKKEN